MDTSMIKTTDIMLEFAEATKRKDYEHLDRLLHEQGEYEIQDKDHVNLDANKNEFLTWYKTKLEDATITDIAYDECVNCFVGGKVVLFNEGNFPRTIKDVFERAKTGLMIQTANGKIMKMKFCFGFLKTENKYEHQYRSAKVKALTEQGYSQREAYIKVSGFDPADYF